MRAEADSDDLIVFDSKIYPLEKAVSFPGRDSLDMCFSFMAQLGRDYRLWILSPAVCPEVSVNDTRFRVTGHPAEVSLWRDMGTTTDLFGILGRAGVGQLRFHGISEEEKASSLFAITAQTDIELTGDRDEAERALWGISRREAGDCRVTPQTVIAGEPSEFTIAYAAGARGLPVGSRILLCIPYSFPWPQTGNPCKDGWLEIPRADKPLELAHVGCRDSESQTSVRGDALFVLPEGLPSWGKVTFRYHTSYTYPFEATFTDAEPRHWFRRGALFSLAVAVDRRRAFMFVRQEQRHQIHLRAGPTARLQLLLPGRRREGDPLKLVGVVTDRNRNPTTDEEIPVPWRVMIEGTRSLDLGMAAGHVERPARHRFTIPLPRLSPGVYRAKAVDSESGRQVAESNPLQILPAGSECLAIYWGEIHAHTEMSDGAGRFDEMLRFAREESRLDFTASSDHACYYTDNDWLRMQETVNRENRDGTFVVLLGYEWAGRQGHRNVYSAADRLELFRGMYPPTSELKVVYDFFHGKEDVVAGPHGMHVGNFFAHHDPDVERFFEVCSMFGQFDRKAIEFLRAGAVFGFTGGGDCHYGRPGFSADIPGKQGAIPHDVSPRCIFKCGVTGVLLPELSRSALVHGLRERRTYATTGARNLVDFSISGLPMGTVGLVSGNPVLRAEIHACGDIEQIEVVRNGEVAYRKTDCNRDLEFDWEDESPPKMRTWYYLDAIQNDGERTWTSPIWIDAGDAS